MILPCECLTLSTVHYLLCHVQLFDDGSDDVIALGLLSGMLSLTLTLPGPLPSPSLTLLPNPTPKHRPSSISPSLCPFSFFYFFYIFFCLPFIYIYVSIYVCFIFYFKVVTLRMVCFHGNVVLAGSRGKRCVESVHLRSTTA